MYLLIKPSSGACNLRCRYCFYTDEMNCRKVARRPFMSKEFFALIIDKALSHLSLQNCRDRNLSIGFQGGEPTLSGLEFFRFAVKYVSDKTPKEIKVAYFLQTNGMTVDEEWARFFKENNFLIGLSMDGNSELHDKNRIDERGAGTHKRVNESARILRKYGCDFNILTVVTRDTARYPQKIYNYYKKLGFSFQQYIPCISPLDGEDTVFALTPERYGDFLCKLFDVWYDDVVHGRAVYNREFENYIGILLGRPPEECGMAGVCSVQYLIESDGSVYPCDFFALDEYMLGNLSTDSFSDIDGKRERIGFIERSKKLPGDCEACRYLPLCRGGCRRNRNEDGKNRFCLAYKKFFEYALPRLQNIARAVANSRK